MAFKVAILCLAVLLGCNAFPVEEEEQDMSIFFDHTDPEARIVGGTNAGNVPYMVALTTGSISRSFLCGASIVTRRTILTAAHCMRAAGGNNPSNSLRGTVGTNRWSSGGSSHAFQRGIMHAQYNHNQIKNDIGILITSANMALSSSIAPIVMNYDFAGAGMATRVTGWGRTSAGGPLSPTLLELRPTVMDGNRCVQDLARRAQELNIRAPPVHPNIEICTFLANGRGTCNGDSGSPLVRADRNQQIGIVSWGLPCARGAPDMFVRVSAYRSWIISNTV
ncbi:chymotrypsin-1-like [Maniola hyperantus]|uniref:chymotrypsin-1-like n=1 Tax=Aphantopus hyperantus TaxID=2795564 RepID=UPI001568AD5A|nr:chymotrypsin-1-like [Maniola hyperantus]